MALDLEPALAESLRDSTHLVWQASELTTILGYALEETNRVRPRVVSDLLSLVSEQDQYTLVNVYTVFRVDLLDSTNKVVMLLPAGSWEIWGDNASLSQTLYINPQYARVPYKLRVHGYGPYVYTGTTANPPLQVQEAILAVARAEALRRVATERSRFEQYATGNPRSDTSVSEVIGQVQDAERRAQQLLTDIKLIRRPTAGKF